MANALDYIAWRGDLSFEVAPINEVDLFLCTQIAMIDFKDIVSSDQEGISLWNAAKAYFAAYPEGTNLGVFQPGKALPALKAMGRAKRYKHVMLSGHVNFVCQENDEQFSATLLRLSPEVCVVAYRGTDDYLVGWKEDCNMAIYDEVPAQNDALRYLEDVAAAENGRLIIAGHSKGGNLAVFAATHAGREIQDRIIHIFNYDGPGFAKKFIEKDPGYAAMKDKISTIVSQNSIIGMIMEPPGKVMFVKSNVDGLYAHDAFNWEVDVNHFMRVRGLSKFARTFREVFSNTMNKMTVEDKKAFVDELFGILFETGADTIVEFKKLRFGTTVGTFNKLTSSKAIRDFFTTFMISLMNSPSENK